jgi:hypothetical protein
MARPEIEVVIVRPPEYLLERLGEESGQNGALDRENLEKLAAVWGRGATFEECCVNVLVCYGSGYDELNDPHEYGPFDEPFDYTVRHRLQPPLRKSRLDAVAERYPWLREECARQKMQEGLEDDPGSFVVDCGAGQGRQLRDLDADYLRGLTKRPGIRKSLVTRIERHLAERQSLAG